MNRNSFYRIILVIASAIIILSCSGRTGEKIVILGTTDIHGIIFPYDYVEKKKLNASLAGISSYVKEVRKKEQVILLDNGDNLQGQPCVYYYNYIDTLSSHLNSLVMNYLKYDAGTVGNHDIEAGHAVYDRLRKEYRFPLLAANAVKTSDGKPYFEPFTIIEKNGLKVAIFGLITPSVPEWLPPVLYSGIEFNDMVKTAEKWMPVILEQKPDIVIGLFHSGYNRQEEQKSGNLSTDENSTASVAFNVRGFDIIFAGHDHNVACEKIINKWGDSVLILNAGSRAEKIARADIEISNRGKKKTGKISISGSLIDACNFEPDKDFVNQFSSFDSVIKSFTEEVIGESTSTISSRDAFFGPSAFVDMIHSFQLEITGADISFAAPLSFDVSIEKGPVTVGDMFKLYRYENMLYTMELKGYEIVKYLEYSYSGWLNTMKGPEDHLLSFRSDENGKLLITGGRAWLKNQAYNFDSAAGIEYIVDASKPAGERIKIISFADGRPFSNDGKYLVALNSYRGSGGGGHLTRGVSLSKEELAGRLKYSTVRDLRYYIMESIRKKRVINPEPFTRWKIVPEDWVKRAREKDYRLLFRDNKR